VVPDARQAVEHSVDVHFPAAISSPCMSSRSHPPRAAQGVRDPILTAYSGWSAPDVLSGDHEIDVVISDVMMPGMIGFELGDAIRPTYPKTCLPDASRDSEQTWEIRDNCLDFVSKPGLVMDELKLWRTKKPRPQREKRGFLDFAGLLRMSRWCSGRNRKVGWNPHEC
jgi:CheY-like chemotaxis protein